ncbi:hypothetical protein LEMES_01403 [Leuconostoc mesenteroides]|nr:hypothetical protein LEMES_01403 [Leuconostoc mesenteroides]
MNMFDDLDNKEREYEVISCSNCGNEFNSQYVYAQRIGSMKNDYIYDLLCPLCAPHRKK